MHVACGVGSLDITVAYRISVTGYHETVDSAERFMP